MQDSVTGFPRFALLRLCVRIGKSLPLTSELASPIRRTYKRPRLSHGGAGAPGDLSLFCRGP